MPNKQVGDNNMSVLVAHRGSPWLEDHFETDGKPSLYLSIQLPKYGAGLYGSCTTTNGPPLTEYPDPKECTYVGTQLMQGYDMATNQKEFVEYLKDWVNQPQDKYLYFANAPIDHYVELEMDTPEYSPHTLDCEPELLKYIAENHRHGTLHMQIKYKRRLQNDLTYDLWRNHMTYEYYKSMKCQMTHNDQFARSS